MIQINLECRKRLTDLENELMVVGGGKDGGKEIVKEFGMDMCTLLYLKWITTKTSCIAHGTLLNVMWQPEWEEIWGRTDCSPKCIYG